MYLLKANVPLDHRARYLGLTGIGRYYILEILT